MGQSLLMSVTRAFVALIERGNGLKWGIRIGLDNASSFWLDGLVTIPVRYRIQPNFVHCNGAQVSCHRPGASEASTVAAQLCRHVRILYEVLYGSSSFGTVCTVLRQGISQRDFEDFRYHQRGEILRVKKRKTCMIRLRSDIIL